MPHDNHLSHRPAVTLGRAIDMSKTSGILRDFAYHTSQVISGNLPKPVQDAASAGNYPYKQAM
jgi:hypothetical protein